jgi:hypothetical protein
MTTDETITAKLPAVRPDTRPIPVITDELEWDDDSLAGLRDPPAVITDLATEPYAEQVVAALHGDPRVFELDPLTQAWIASVSRVFEHAARRILADPDAGTPGHAATVAAGKRAAVLLMAGGQDGGTPMRCPACDRIHQPLAIGGPINWDVAGREDIMCPPCWKAQPKHTAKAAPVKAKAAANGTRRRRTPRPKPTGGALPDAAA